MKDEYHCRENKESDGVQTNGGERFLLTHDKSISVHLGLFLREEHLD